MLALGCSDGGGGSSGAVARSDPAPQPSPPPPASDDGSSVQRVVAVLAWDQASGPVKGYRVYIEWDGSGDFAFQEDVGISAVAVEGEVGQSFRMQVSGLDSAGAEGPRSPPSKPIVFTSRMPPAGGYSGSAAAAAAAAAADGASTPPPAPAPDSGRDPVDDDPPPAAREVAGAVDGDTRPDLLWESRDGRRLRFTGPDLVPWLELGRPGPEWSFAGMGDVDGDARPDLFWQNGFGEVFVSRAALLLAAPDAAPLEPWASLDVGEQVESIADYDADGRADALVRDASGVATLWLRRGDDFAWLDLVPPEPEARLVSAAADLDSDGHADRTWTTFGGGWLVQFVVGGRVEGVGALQGNGERLARGDFLGEGGGAEQFLVRHAAGLTVQGLRGTGGPWPLPDESPDALVGCGDYDADGDTDLLWHADGLLHFYYLPGEEVVASDPGWIPVAICHTRS
ncbi:MAG: FG-GAP repeat domain-containing protein [Myxococcota bacterium]